MFWLLKCYTTKRYFNDSIDIKWWQMKLRVVGYFHFNNSLNSIRYEKWQFNVISSPFRKLLLASRLPFHSNENETVFILFTFLNLWQWRNETLQNIMQIIFYYNDFRMRQKNENLMTNSNKMILVTTWQWRQSTRKSKTFFASWLVAFTYKHTLFPSSFRWHRRSFIAKEFLVCSRKC